MGNENTKLCENCRDGLIGSALGMTLRDYFAAKAMQALVSGDIGDLADKDGEEGEPVVAYLARTAYYIADAMLAERAKGQP